MAMSSAPIGIADSVTTNSGSEVAAAREGVPTKVLVQPIASARSSAAVR